MRVFVTGGTGYLGAHIVQHLSDSGNECTVLSRSSPSEPSTQRFKTITGDLTAAYEWKEALHGHDACVHAGIIWPEDGEDYDLADLRASVALFSACADAEVKHVVYISSTAVHRPFKKLMSESDALGPMDAYGATKLAGETFLHGICAERGVLACVIRPGPVAGNPTSGAKPNCDRRFGQFLIAAKGGNPIEVIGGEARQFVHPQEIATLCNLVLERQSTGVFLAVGEDLITWQSIAERIVRATGSRSEIIVRQDSSEDRPFFDVSRLRSEFGMTFSSERAVTEMIDFLLSEYQNPC